MKKDVKKDELPKPLDEVNVQKIKDTLMRENGDADPASNTRFFYQKEDSNEQITSKEYVKKLGMYSITKSIPAENVLNPDNKWDYHPFRHMLNIKKETKQKNKSVIKPEITHEFKQSFTNYGQFNGIDPIMKLHEAPKKKVVDGYAAIMK